MPGLVRRSDGLIRLAPNLEWHDVSFGGIVLAALGLDVPVSLANDADLGALAEHTRGAGVGIDDLIYVSGNVGVGAGVITGGHRLEGAGGYAGEIGHLRFNPAGRPCHCGNRGCWETEVGGHAIAEAIHCPPDKVAQLDEVLDGFAKPSPELRATGTALGQGLASIVNMFNPQMVVLGGYFRSLYMLVGAEVNAGLADRALPAPLESVTLALPGLGSDSPLLGAAEIALEPLFVDPVAALGIGARRRARPARRLSGRRPRQAVRSRSPANTGPKDCSAAPRAAAWMPSVLVRSSGRTCTAEARRSSSVRRAGSSTRSPSGAK